MNAFLEVFRKVFKNFLVILHDLLKNFLLLKIYEKILRKILLKCKKKTEEIYEYFLFLIMTSLTLDKDQVKQVDFDKKLRKGKFRLRHNSSGISSILTKFVI